MLASLFAALRSTPEPPEPYPNQAFLGLQKTKGGGGGHIAPHSKNPVTLLRIHSSDVFFSESLSKNESLDTTLVSWKPRLAF